MTLSRRAFVTGAAAVLAARSAGAASGGRAASTSAAGTAAPGASTRPPVDVVVLGAGLSGLNAALLLEEQGASVRVLDARRRVGGRLYTLFDLPGHPEVGGNNMAGGYGRTLEMARRCGLKTIDYAKRLGMSAPGAIAVDGELMTREQWARSPRNPLPEAERDKFPGEYVGRLLAAHNPLASAEGWVDPANAKLDRPLYEVLRELGVSDEIVRLGFDRNVSYGTSSHDLSALMYWYVDRWNALQRKIAPVAYAIDGGNQKLPLAMAQRLKGDVVLGSEVVAIEDRGERVVVRCRDGSRHEARHVVCSLPFSVLRETHFDPVLTGPQAQAVATLPYMKITQVFFLAKRPFWRDDGLSPAFVTDGPAGTFIGQRFGAGDDEISFFSANLRGHTAEYADRFGPDAGTRLVLDEIERLRPAAKGALQPVGFHSWGLDPYSAGDWAVFAPGQVAAFGGRLAAPHGRVHFCGEHTATANRGMEGAMESGERAALEVLGAA